MKLYFDDDLNECVHLFRLVFSSPEVKAHAHVVRRPSVRLSINFSHFHLLNNHRAKFNPTLHKASLSKEDSRLWFVKFQGEIIMK